MQEPNRGSKMTGMKGEGLLKSLKKARKKVSKGLSKAGDAIQSGAETVGNELTNMTSKMHQVHFSLASSLFQSYQKIMRNFAFIKLLSIK